MKAGDASVWATDCPLAAIQFGQFAGKKALHPMSILARAYRGEGFDSAAVGRPRPVASRPSDPGRTAASADIVGATPGEEDSG